jgi:hypothetical protein
MSKTIDLGKKIGDPIGMIDMKMDYVHYPDLYISDSDDPKLADIPDKGECTIKYRVCSRTHHEDKDGDGKKRHTCSLRLEIVSITPPEKKKNGNGKAYGDDARKSFGEFFKDK